MMLLPATTHVYLERAAESLREAITTTDVPARYAHAHVAALRAAAALLAARAHPDPKRRRQKNAWVLLAEVAPELAEWSTFFASGAVRSRAFLVSGAVRSCRTESRHGERIVSLSAAPSRYSGISSRSSCARATL